MNKTEYIKQLKKLIKKYHPDLCGSEDSELLYNEITKKLTNILNKIKTNDADEIIVINEQDYTYYKLGIKYYKNIHPNQFYKRNPDRTSQTKTYNELVSALNNIFLSFNAAEYYFNKLITDYPGSAWAEDAKNKITLLKKLHKSYDNINLEENKTVNSESFMNEMGLKMM